MGLAIILRKNGNTNRFRDIVIAAISAGCGDDLLLCSGFFQETYHGNAYRASQEQQFARLLSQNNVRVTTVGIHNYSWRLSYKNFANSLAQAGVVVTALIKPTLHWHAKVLILKRGGTPVLGIVGSSNITRNAFSVSTPFNYESDVYMWDDTDGTVFGMMEQQLARIENPEELIRAPYDPQTNGNMTIPQRLIRLEQEVMSEEYHKLDFKE